MGKDRLILGVSSNILFLGVVSFFTDVSTELIAAVLPAFLFVTLGTTPEIIGTIEGAAESLTSFLKLVAGVVADKTGNRKRLTIAGYSLSNFVKPLMGFVSSWPQVMALRMADRIGKGIRTPPRDAIIADCAEESKMGKAFGIHRTLDQLGAVVGPLLAFALLSPLGFEGMFLFTIIPGSIAVAVLFIFVKEPERRQSPNKTTLKGASKIMNTTFSMYIGSATLYAVAAISYSFILLRGIEMGLPTEYTVLVYAGIQVCHVIAGYPAGVISDRLGRVKAVQIGYALLFISFLTISLAPSTHIFVVGAALFGLHQGVVETSQRAIIPSLVPSEYKGTAYGVYNTAIGIVTLPTNLAAGFIFSALGSAATFGYGAAFAVVGSAAMALTQRRISKSGSND